MLIEGGIEGVANDTFFRATEGKQPKRMIESGFAVRLGRKSRAICR
jgi:hypothetical protein